MWSLIATVAYLEQLRPHEEYLWNNRYGKLMELFKETNKGSPMDIAPGFGEVVQTVFVII